MYSQGSKQIMPLISWDSVNPQEDSQVFIPGNSHSECWWRSGLSTRWQETTERWVGCMSWPMYVLATTQKTVTTKDERRWGTEPFSWKEYINIRVVWFRKCLADSSHWLPCCSLNLERGLLHLFLSEISSLSEWLSPNWMDDCTTEWRPSSDPTRELSAELKCLLW